MLWENIGEYMNNWKNVENVGKYEKAWDNIRNYRTSRKTGKSGTKTQKNGKMMATVLPPWRMWVNIGKHGKLKKWLNTAEHSYI